MDELEQARHAIDAIDGKIVELFEKRMKEVEKVVQYKMEHDLPILDSSREQAIVKKNCERVSDAYRAYFEEVYQSILVSSKQFQKEIIERTQEHGKIIDEATER